jgi:hypothetical protein
MNKKAPASNLGTNIAPKLTMWMFSCILLLIATCIQGTNAACK